MPRSHRIVSLLPAATEILFDLGLGDEVLAVSHECDWPAAARHKPRVTTSRVNAAAAGAEIDVQVKSLASDRQPLYDIDLPQIAALRPSLIVTQAQCDVCAVRLDDVLAAVQTVPALAGTRVVALSPQSLADVLDDIRTVGAATDASEAASELIARLQSRVDRVRKLTAGLSPTLRPRVACIEWIEPLMLAGNWTAELVELAGGRSDLARPGVHSAYVDWHDIVAYDPQVIVVMPCGYDLDRAASEAVQLFEKPGWADISAVCAGRVFAVDGSAYFNRPGPRLVDSLELLIHFIHPSLAPLPTQYEGMARRLLD